MIHRGLVFWSVAAIATAVGLFSVKYRVQDLEETLDRTNHRIVESQKATHMLRVEWAHLNEAERIERLAQKHLKLEPATIRQAARLEPAKTDSVPPRREPPLSSPPRTGTDVPSSNMPGGGRVAAEVGTPPPTSAPLSPQRSPGPTTPPRPATTKEPAPPGPGGEGLAAASIDELLQRQGGERR